MTRTYGVVVLSIVALAAAIALGVSFGTEPVSLARAIADAGSLDRDIVLDVRLPRVLLGAVAGAGLSIVGVALQALLRNPLAEPYVLGVSGGSAVGATFAILAGVSSATSLGASVVPLFALAGGLGATALVHTLAAAAPDSRGASVLLAGVVVNAIASAAITFVKTLVTQSKAQELLFWLTGFLDVPSRASLGAMAAYVAIGAAVLLRDAARLNLLSLGDSAAEHLGVSVRGVERRTYLASSLVVGAIVSVTGLIGFVGLLVPHALRRLVGPDARRLMPASLGFGGAVLVVCDLVSRAAFRFLHTEPPVGAVTALIGGTLFLLLLGRRPHRA
ncbi:MAG: iron ABC transporter permease [Labilithrix sp.]|nr:iron ABC transporter permease [Labilithrix sp.]MCW5833055.1 iron ABC transporter permease [Labilithrix sp.]